MYSPSMNETSPDRGWFFHTQNKETEEERMLNHITIMGRLTRDPELRRTGSGLAMARFTLAVDRDFAPKDGGERECDFIGCIAWRQTGEFVSKYFAKGRMAVVAGRLQVRNWTDKDGSKRRSTEVVAESVYFGDSKRPADAPAYDAPPIPPASDFPALDESDAQLPFDEH